MMVTIQRLPKFLSAFHCERFSRAGLTIGKHADIEAIQNRLNQSRNVFKYLRSKHEYHKYIMLYKQQDNLFLSGRWQKHSFKFEGLESRPGIISINPAISNAINKEKYLSASQNSSSFSSGNRTQSSSSSAAKGRTRQ